MAASNRSSKPDSLSRLTSKPLRMAPRSSCGSQVAGKLESDWPLDAAAAPMGMSPTKQVSRMNRMSPSIVYHAGAKLNSSQTLGPSPNASNLGTLIVIRAFDSRHGSL